ncbi:MAG: hypothetical protein QOH63_265 [Acidobacteriota bacterium]|jgi:hypothetical protein|nr:hypothetical protein [Acidobacteriota bacterium]
MSQNLFPESLFEFAFIPHIEDRLNELVGMAEPEEWGYQHTESQYAHPVLYNYLQYTYRRVAEEGKIATSPDGEFATFNTGLVTRNQEPIYILFNRNMLDGARQQWHIHRFCRRAEYDLNRFPNLPDMAHYFDEPAALVFDTRKEFRANIEHIIIDNRERFPEPYRSMDDYALQTFLKGAIDNSKERVRRNYKTAIPQYYRGRIQLLLPLCISNPDKADLALVVEDHGNFYRASTCLTLDMAYNNAGQLARPDRDWLQP